MVQVLDLCIKASGKMVILRVLHEGLAYEDAPCVELTAVEHLTVGSCQAQISPVVVQSAIEV